MEKTLKQISDEIAEFCEKRGWENDDPNQLISSMIIELGELTEHYQWINSFSKIDKNKKEEISYELVDVLFYLLQIGNKTGIDIEKAFNDKITKLEKKFPIGITEEDYQKVHEDYRKSGKNRLYK
jgi:dCTP diphosphatase